MEYKVGQIGYVVSVDKSEVGESVHSHDGFLFATAEGAQVEVESAKEDGPDLDFFAYKAEITSLDHNGAIQCARVLAHCKAQEKKLYRDEDDLIDSMGGNLQDIIELIKLSDTLDSFISKLPYPVSSSDPVVQKIYKAYK